MRTIFQQEREGGEQGTRVSRNPSLKNSITVTQVR